ncbi:hypothetical protein QBC32DRAFT_222290 [Pseudoneurospora amorphoporcata]|uniref:Uncharacterized protein n=1 Tax=Pseudoneurospora amorphoporcata TaxID=241081 RepID=A0AAN6NQF6_9PEZI|nr:hypothetical protein QBC32DRAFT_222290 [Pseudoneurospora amorphoporcata]
MTGFMPGPHCGRGTIDIIWNCLSTTLLAIWVSLHLPVDSPYTPTVFQALKGIFAPEPAAAVSIYNLLEASRLKQILITSGVMGFETFSLRQAFIIQLQGVYVEDKDGVKELLTRHQLEEFALNGQLEFKDLPTNDQIADRSKTDRLLKSISVIQTLWFLANIIYRLCTGLQISLLEDFTAAYAVCGLVQLVASFRCPQDVCQGFVIHLRPESDSPPQAHPRRRKTNPLLRKETLGYPLLFWVVFASCSAVFVAIHLAAWNYPFPSVTEQWLWRSCSLAMLPLLVLFYLCDHFLRKDGHLTAAGAIGLNFSLGLYIIARLILISLVFAAFRKAPVGIYKDATWTDLIPHI